MVRRTQPPSSTSQGSVLSSSAGGKSKSKSRAVLVGSTDPEMLWQHQKLLSLLNKTSTPLRWDRASLLNVQPLQSAVSSNRKKPSDFVESSSSDLPSFSSRSGFGMGFFARDSRGPSSGSLLILDGTLRSKREEEHHDFGHRSPVLALFCTLRKPIHGKNRQIGTLYKCHNHESRSPHPVLWQTVFFW